MEFAYYVIKSRILIFIKNKLSEPKYHFDSKLDMDLHFTEEHLSLSKPTMTTNGYGVETGRACLAEIRPSVSPI